MFLPKSSSEQNSKLLWGRGKVNNRLMETCGEVLKSPLKARKCLHI